MPADACKILLVQSMSAGRVWPSQFGSSIPEPKSKKPAVSVLPDGRQRYSRFAAPTRAAPAGDAEYFVVPADDTDETKASGPSSPARSPLTKSSPENKRA